jgi:hypothetical protein
MKRKEVGNQVKMKLIDAFAVYTKDELTDYFNQLNRDERRIAFMAWGLVYNQIANSINSNN